MTVTDFEVYGGTYQTMSVTDINGTDHLARPVAGR